MQQTFTDAQTWELAVAAGAVSRGAFTFGSPAAATVPLGGDLTLDGVAVSVPADIYWQLTVAVAGQGLQTQERGQGPASFSLVLGPLETAGTVTLNGSLVAAYDFALTQQLSGSPETQQASGVATVQTPAATLGIVTGLAASFSAESATYVWAPAGPFTELELTDSTGTQHLGVRASGDLAVTGNGTTTFGPDGEVGFFTAGSTATGFLPVGFTGYVHARAAGGIGPTATVGDWSPAVLLRVSSGAPVWQLSNPQPYLSETNPGHVDVTLTNVGAGSGSPGTLSSVFWGQGNNPFIIDTGNATPSIVLGPGESAVIRVPNVQSATFAYGYLGELYSVSVVVGTEYEGYAQGQAPAGAIEVTGSVTTTGQIQP